MSITVRNIKKAFGSFNAVNDVSIEVASGELVALLGPSGSVSVRSVSSFSITLCSGI